MIGDILQPTHLIFILLVALLVLGPKRLPEAGRALGKGIRDFKGAVAGITEDTSLQVPATPVVNQTTPAPAPAVTVAPVQPVAPAHPFPAPAAQVTPPPLTLTGSASVEPPAPATAWVDVESTNHSE